MKKLLLASAMLALTAGFASADVVRLATEGAYPPFNFIDDKAGKPVGIQQHIGRRPLMAFGNSDGDFQMLEWTTTGPGPRFAMIVHHDDAEREWAYDRESHIGGSNQSQSRRGPPGNR